MMPKLHTMLCRLHDVVLDHRLAHYVDPAAEPVFDSDADAEAFLAATRALSGPPLVEELRRLTSIVTTCPVDAARLARCDAVCCVVRIYTDRLADAAVARQAGLLFLALISHVDIGLPNMHDDQPIPKMLLALPGAGVDLAALPDIQQHAFVSSLARVLRDSFAISWDQQLLDVVAPLLASPCLDVFLPAMHCIAWSIHRGDGARAPRAAECVLRAVERRTIDTHSMDLTVSTVVGAALKCPGSELWSSKLCASFLSRAASRAAQDPHLSNDIVGMIASLATQALSGGDPARAPLLQPRFLNPLLALMPIAVARAAADGMKACMYATFLVRLLANVYMRIPAAAPLLLASDALEACIRTAAATLRLSGSATACDLSHINQFFGNVVCGSTGPADRLRRFFDAGGFHLVCALAWAPSQDQEQALIVWMVAMDRVRQLAPTGHAAHFYCARFVVDMWARLAARPSASQAYLRGLKFVVPGLRAVASSPRFSALLDQRSDILSAHFDGRRSALPELRIISLEALCGFTFVPRSLTRVRALYVVKEDDDTPVAVLMFPGSPAWYSAQANICGAPYTAILLAPLATELSNNCAAMLESLVDRAATRAHGVRSVQPPYSETRATTTATLRLLGAASRARRVKPPFFAAVQSLAERLVALHVNQAVNRGALANVVTLLCFLGLLLPRVALGEALVGRREFFALCAREAAGDATAAAATAWLCRRLLAQSPTARGTLRRAGAAETLAQLTALPAVPVRIRHSLQAALDSLLAPTDEPAHLAARPPRAAGLPDAVLQLLLRGAMFNVRRCPVTASPTPLRCVLFVTGDLKWLVCKDPRARTADGELRVRIVDMAVAGVFAGGGADNERCLSVASARRTVCELEAPTREARDAWLTALTTLCSTCGGPHS